MKRYLPLLLAVSVLASLQLSAQSTTNKGKEFWVGYAHHQYMETGTNTQNMCLYLGGANSTATVTVELDSSGSIPSQWFRRTYTIPANTFVTTENLPKGPINATISGSDPNYDARLYTNPPPSGSGGEGLFRKKGIHILSNVPIVAETHVYGSVAADITELIPVDNWGSSYVSMNSRQLDAGGPAYSFVFVVAKEDSTLVEIIPSVATRLNKPAGVSFYVQLQKGQIYQIIGQSDGGGNGNEFTGTKVNSHVGIDGRVHPIGVFSGSSRTRGEDVPCGTGSGRDPDLQQLPPLQEWGKRFITAPLSSASSILFPTSFQTSVYKIVVSSPSTVVKRNGATMAGLIGGSYYKFSSNTADYIEADRPICIGQFMSGSSSCNPGTLGDPDFTIVPPINQGIDTAAFYRTSRESISFNYVTIIVPTAHLAALKINDSSNFNNVYNHPNQNGYSVVIKGWSGANQACKITCDTTFTAMSYGLGGAESYLFTIAKHDSIGIPSTVRNKVVGVLYLDINKNAIKELNEPYFSEGNVITFKGSDTSLAVPWSGFFFTLADTGTYVTKVQPYLNYFSVIPPSHTSTFSTYNTVDTVRFAIQPLPGMRDLAIHLMSSTSARPGMPVTYVAYAKNMGTDTVTNVVVKFVKDTNTVYIGSIPVAVRQTGDTLTWNIDSLHPGRVLSMIVYAGAKPILTIGDTLTSHAIILPVATDLTPANNSTILRQRVGNSYDPNDKTESHGGSMNISQVQSGEYLQYTIRFQNTGNDPAHNVAIRDTLSTQLWGNSIQIVGASHDFQLTIDNGKYCTWSFNNINLPDSTTDEANSHGYVSFIVRPKSSLVVGDTIRNRAAIYFDYNTAVMTNVEKTAIVSAISPLKLLSFSAKRSGKYNLLQWNTTQEVNVDGYEVERSTNGRDFTLIGKVKAGSSNYTFTDAEPLHAINYYRLRMVDEDGRFSYSPVRMVNNSGTFSVAVYPNPAKDKLQLQIDCEKKTPLTLQIISPEGKIVYSGTWPAPEGTSLKAIGINTLAKGHYYLTAIAGDEQHLLKFEKL